jgi:para-nitrobenzyl esterase
MSQTTSVPLAAREDSAPEVTTTAGRYRGLQRPGSAAFLGIPFAKPPVGELRFAAPARPERFDGVRLATSYGATPQRRPFGDLTTIPEPSIPGDSTLNVNVFTPAPGDTEALLPVFVWIHGGGYFAGSPASPWYDGRAFNRDGVVTVTVSYRLGFDGFGWMDGAPLNRGVLDQIAALEWVHENIGAFGGDPARVTIGGQSAGGGSVFTLLAAPGARGLFHQAISHSGAAGASTAADAEAVGRRFAAAMSIEPTAAAWRTLTEDQVLDHERDFNTVDLGAGMTGSPADVIEATRKQGAGSLSLAFVPVVDGEIVLDFDQALRQGASADLPLLLGTTRNEFAFPSPLTGGAVAADLRAAGISPSAVETYRSRLADVGDEYAQSLLVVTQMFRAPAARVVDLREGTGSADRTWLYDFAYRSAVTGVAAHCQDLPFAWDLLDAEGVHEQFGANPPQALADAMHAAWVRFVTTGQAPWPSAGEHAAGAEVFDESSSYLEADYALDAEIASVRGAYRS